MFISWFILLTNLQLHDHWLTVAVVRVYWPLFPAIVGLGPNLKMLENISLGPAYDDVDALNMLVQMDDEVDIAMNEEMNEVATRDQDF